MAIIYEISFKNEKWVFVFVFVFGTTVGWKHWKGVFVCYHTQKEFHQFWWKKLCCCVQFELIYIEWFFAFHLKRYLCLAHPDWSMHKENIPRTLAIMISIERRGVPRIHTQDSRQWDCLFRLKMVTGSNSPIYNAF